MSLADSFWFLINSYQWNACISFNINHPLMFVFAYYLRRGGKAFIDSLLPRLKPENTNGVLSMPFVLEVNIHVTKSFCTIACGCYGIHLCTMSCNSFNIDENNILLTSQDIEWHILDFFFLKLWGFASNF